MKHAVLIAGCLLILATEASAKRVRCTDDEIAADAAWSTKLCEGGTRDTTQSPIAPLRPPSTKFHAGVPEWASAMQVHEQLVVKAIEVGDIEELKRQAIDLRRRSNEPSSWPDDDNWTLARVSCATMAQELANFVDDKLKGTARGEIAAEGSIKAYRAAGPRCKRGLLKLK